MKVLLSWSSGKDSAWALHCLQRRDDVKVVGLLTTVNEVYDRVAMHAVRRSLLMAQAEAVGVPLWSVSIPSPCSNEAYEAAMTKAMTEAREAGIAAVAFGDLYLEDIRKYREDRMRATGIDAIFPVWGLPTLQLARQMIASGLKAHVTCVDPAQIDRDLVGRQFDADFLADLPESADPCGENGEFHTFVHEGPMMRYPLDVVTGERIERDGFMFSDLKLKELTDAQIDEDIYPKG